MAISGLKAACAVATSPRPAEDGGTVAWQVQPGLTRIWLFQGELYRMCRESLDCDPKVAEILVAHPDLLGDR